MADTNAEVLAELKRIRELLTPAPAPPAPPAPKGMMQEFKAFLSEYKVLGLAVAFILGVYLGQLVKALVGDLVLPILNPLLPPGSSMASYVVDGFGVGDFFLNLLTFIIVAFVIFIIVKMAKRYKIS